MTDTEARVRIVATDMDGTLLDDEGNIPAGFMEWVVSHPDVHVVIASGRQVYTLMEQFAPIRERLDFIADNGSVVMVDGEFTYVNSIEPDTVRAIAAIAEKIPRCVPIFCGLKSAYISRFANEQARRSLEQYYARRAYVDDPLKALEQDRIVKIALYFEKDARSEEAACYMADLPEGLEFVVSSEHWMDVANASVNKGAALRSMQQRLGISAEQCMAFGDYLNDLELLRACGMSYAMENAVPEVKAVAAHIAPANTDNGVMQILSALD